MGNSESVVEQFRRLDESAAINMIKSRKNKKTLNIRDKEGNTLIMIALQHAGIGSQRPMKSLAMEILNTPEIRAFNVSTINSYGESALIYAVSFDQSEEIALKILEHPSECGLDISHATGVTHCRYNLEYAICMKSHRIVLKLLEYPILCQLNTPSRDYRETLFFRACKWSTSEIAIKILQIGDWNIQCQANSYGIYPLMLACSRGMSELVLAILNYTTMGIDSEDLLTNTTCLMSACRSCTEDVALKLLESHGKCRVTHCSARQTAFTIAYDMNFTRVTELLLKHYSIKELLGLSSTIWDTIDRYMVTHLTDFIENLPNKEYIKENIALFDAINKSVSQSASVKNCLLCGTEQKSNTVYIKCKHTISMCATCTSKLYVNDNKCPVCRTPSNIITDVYIV